MIYTRRKVVKKLALVLVLGVLLGWTLHVLVTNLIISYHRDKPIVLGAVAEAQTQIYQVDVFKHSLGAVPILITSLSLRRVAWDRPEKIVPMITHRLKLSPGAYSLSITSSTGQRKNYHFTVKSKKGG